MRKPSYRTEAERQDTASAVDILEDSSVCGGDADKLERLAAQFDNNFKLDCVISRLLAVVCTH